MSIFDEDNRDVKQSILFFNHLLDADKVKIVSDLSPMFFQKNLQYRPLFALLSKIQQDISKHTDIEIGNKLMDYGLDETYARLFVSNIKKHAPTQEYQLHQIDMIPEDVFSQNIANMLHDVWVKNENAEQLAERYGVDKERIQCLITFTAVVFNRLSRGDTYTEDVARTCKGNISGKKSDVLLEQISRYADHHHKISMFRNIQDSTMNVEQIVRQNREILRLLQELVDLQRRESEDRKT